MVLPESLDLMCYHHLSDQADHQQRPLNGNRSGPGEISVSIHSWHGTSKSDDDRNFVQATVTMHTQIIKKAEFQLTMV